MNKTLYICCPAFALQGPKEKEEYLQPARLFAHQHDLTIHESSLLQQFLGPRERFSEEERAMDVLNGISHDYIWAVRGGYGCLSILPALQQRLRKNKAALIGFSDITALHALWLQRQMPAGFYGRFPVESASRMADALSAYLNNEAMHFSPEPYGMVRILRPGKAVGPVFAACLTVLTSLCGTPCMPDLSGRILMIEDIDERPWQWDSALHQLHQSGALDGITALISGSCRFTENECYNGPSIDDVMQYWSERLETPCIAHLPFGHMDDPIGVPQGRPSELCISEAGSWTLHISQHEEK